MSWSVVTSPPISTSWYVQVQIIFKKIAFHKLICFLISATSKGEEKENRCCTPAQLIAFRINLFLRHCQLLLRLEEKYNEHTDLIYEKKRHVFIFWSTRLDKHRLETTWENKIESRKLVKWSTRCKTRKITNSLVAKREMNLKQTVLNHNEIIPYDNILF